MKRDFDIQIAEIPETRTLPVDFDLDADAATEMLDVSEFSVATGLTLHAKLSRARETIRAKVEVAFDVDFVCGRCLESQRDSLKEATEFVLISRSQWVNDYAQEEVELEPSDLDVEVYDSDVIELAPLFRETMLEALPIHAVCPESRQATCDAAFEKNIGDKAVAELEEAKIDVRWGPLLDLKKKQKD